MEAGLKEKERNQVKKVSSIDYGEFTAADHILWWLNGIKSNQSHKLYSFFAPLSRQEKGVDLILYKKNSQKVATIQVKTSRSYQSDGNHKIMRYNFLWLNYFNINDEAKADFYVIVGNYFDAPQEILEKKNGLSVKAIDYKPIILIYSQAEMIEELGKIRQKKIEQHDKFFSFKFRDETDIVLDRGFVKGYNTINNGDASRAEFVIGNKIDKIISFFD